MIVSGLSRTTVISVAFAMIGSERRRTSFAIVSCSAGPN
jgi:hypothetical protein